MHERIGDLRVADILTFLAVRRVGSLSAAARQVRVTPSQVKKAVDRVGEALGVTLLARTGRGVSLTADAGRVAPALEDMVARLRGVVRGDADVSPPLTLAAPSYLAAAFLPVIAAALPRTRVRGLQLAPAAMRAYATERLFDVALTVGAERLPEIWVAHAVGEVKKGLFAAPAVARALRPFPASVDSVKALSFVGAMYSSGGGVSPGDDDCPLREGRRTWHEAETIGMALELAARSDQVVFGPHIAARRLVEQGLLEEIPVRGWTVSDPLRVACHADRVLAPVQKAIVAALRANLAEVSGPSSKSS